MFLKASTSNKNRVGGGIIGHVSNSVGFFYHKRSFTPKSFNSTQDRPSTKCTKDKLAVASVTAKIYWSKYTLRSDAIIGQGQQLSDTTYNQWTFRNKLHLMVAACSKVLYNMFALQSGRF